MTSFVDEQRILRLAASNWAGNLLPVVLLVVVKSSSQTLSRLCTWRYVLHYLLLTLLDSKIRLQIQGEAAKLDGAKPKGAIHIIRQLGILGLYKGSSACLLRDIPFSAIYFTAYSHLRKDVFQEGYNGKQLSFLETLAAAGIA